MTTKQLNYKALPIIAAADGATSPTLTSNDKGAMAWSTTTTKPMSWDGAKWNLLTKVDSVAGKTGAVTVTKADVGLSNVDNVAASSLRDRTTHTGEQAISSVTGLQTALDGKSATTHTHAAATTTVAGFMSNTDKTKLDGIAAGANNYAHPANHPASIITQDSNNRFVTDAEKTTWNAKIGTVKTINGQSIVGSGDLVISGGLDPNNSLVLNNDAIFNNVRVGSGNNSNPSNTVVGKDALKNNTDGFFNAAIGLWSLLENTTGYSNTAVGSNSLTSNTEGYNNTAIGENSLNNNINGNDNTALGRRALASNVSGGNNVALGVNTLDANIAGYANTAVGSKVMRENTNGSYNCSFGSGSMSQNTSGSFNTAIGLDALGMCTTGSYNISIGTPWTSNGQPSPVFNITTESNRIVMGNTGVTNAYIQVPWTVVSDARDKTNFAAIPHGLDFVKQLKPTAYQFKESRESEETHGGVRYGFKAQDIAAIEPEGVIVDATDSEKLRYNESNLIPILVKAIQELSAEVERLKNATANT